MGKSATPARLLLRLRQQQSHATEKSAILAPPRLRSQAHPRPRRPAPNLATEKGAPLALLPSRARRLQSHAMVKDVHQVFLAAQQHHAQLQPHQLVPRPRSAMASIVRPQKALLVAFPPPRHQPVPNLVMERDVQRVLPLQYHRLAARARRAVHQRVRHLLSAMVNIVPQPQKARLPAALPPPRHIARSLATEKGAHQAPQPLFLHPAAQVPLAQRRQARRPQSAMVNTATLRPRVLLRPAHPQLRRLQALLLPSAMESTVLLSPTPRRRTRHIQAQARVPLAHP